VCHFPKPQRGRHRIVPVPRRERFHFTPLGGFVAKPRVDAKPLILNPSDAKPRTGLTGHAGPISMRGSRAHYHATEQPGVIPVQAPVLE
jgi:hypothetical protein